MLASFLFTPKQQRLLAALLLHPDQDYSFAELKEIALGGYSSLYTYVEQLVAAGVLSVRQVRASRRFAANIKHPLYHELRSIAVKSFAVAEPLKAALMPFASVVERAFIFGSTAKGGDTHASDIDLMVVGDISVGKLVKAMQPAERQTGREIHLNVYDPLEWRQLLQGDPVIKSIAEGPLIELHLTEGTDSSDDESAVGQRPDRHAI